jgi:hypothetical protein
LDAAGAQSLVLPLMGAASSREQALYEGQRVLKECRLINATAGIALGIHDFAEARRSLTEIGENTTASDVNGSCRAIFNSQ